MHNNSAYRIWLDEAEVKNTLAFTMYTVTDTGYLDWCIAYKGHSFKATQSCNKGEMFSTVVTCDNGQVTHFWFKGTRQCNLRLLTLELDRLIDTNNK